MHWFVDRDGAVLTIDAAKCLYWFLVPDIPCCFGDRWVNTEGKTEAIK
jgi:hypothetical protein